MIRRSLATGAAAVGRGLLAGLAGTAAMTVAQTLEMRRSGREASTTPADAAQRVLGIDDFEDEQAHERFSRLMHWGYGTGWGAVRGLLSAAGLGPATATAAHLAVVESTQWTLLPRLELAPPVTEWPVDQARSDLVFHSVYAVATGLAWRILEDA